MSEKRLITRHVQKHDVEANWLKATNFTPLVAEIIIYDIDAQHPHPRFKIGDGVTNVNLLPFAGVDEVSALLQAGKGDKAVQQVLDATSWAPDVDQEEIAQSSAEQSDGNLIVGALGQFSFMEGGKSQAKGKRAHAEGTSTVAVGNYSHSEGNKTGALGTNSHAEGLKSVAQGSVSHAEGSGTKSFGEASHTEGANTVTQGYASHAEGDGAQAIGNSSHAEGYEAIAHGVAAHAEGRSSEAYGDFSHAEGMYSHANGEASHAGGRGAYTNAPGAFAHGDEVLATADFQTVFGRFNETDDEAAFIIGNGESDEARNNAFVIKQDGKVVVNGSALNIEGDKAAGSIKQTTDYASGTFGVENIPESVKDNALIQKDPATGEVLIGALGDFSSAFGGTSQASGKRAHAEGTTVVAAGKYSHAEGNGTVTLGNNTHAEGFKTIAEGPHSHAEGFSSHAVGEGSHAEGYNTKAEATNAHAEGSSTQALGTSSHSEGYEAIAQGTAAHAEGRSSVAQGNFSHAEGMYSHADGEASHAGGRGSYAYEPGSFAHGDEVVANVEFQTVFGRFNELDDEAAFIIGGGEDKENRKNLFTIKQDGRIYVNGEELSAGNIFFAEYGVTTRDEITAAYQAGKACMCKYEGYVYNLCAITEPYIFFSLLDCRLDVDLNGPTAKLVYVGFDDAWLTLQTNFVLPRHLKALNIRGRAQEKSVAQVTDYASWAPDDSQVELIADADVQRNENDEVLSGAFGEFSSAFGGTSQATAKRAHAEGTTTVAAGKYSHTEGNGTYTKGNSAHAEGILTAAIGDNAHSEGDHTRANGNSSHAEGGSTTANGIHSHAEGANTQAIGDQAHAEGGSTTASGTNSHAEGSSTTASAAGAHAEGTSTVASGEYSHAEGNTTEARGYASHAGGSMSLAAHADSFVHGSGLVSGRDQQAVFGVFNEIDENALFAVGVGYSNDDRRTGFQVNMDGQVFVNGNELVNNNNVENGANTGAVSQKHNAESWTPDADQAEVIQSAANKTGNDIAVGAFGQYSFMEGGKSQAKGKRAHAEGTSTVAVGDYSHAEGNKTGSLAPNSHAEGLKSVAQGGASHAEGGNTKAIGEASHTEGVDTIARSYASHAEGAITETKKDYSHAEGYTSIADGIASHAEGYGTLTGNDAAHAEGLGTRAMGAYAHAEGAHTEATGDNSHAEGVATKATAYAAHAGGDSTEANHSGSFAHGAVLKTGRDQQAVFGKFNEVDADALFVVGNGESADAPSNAFVVKQDGKIWINGTSLNIEGGVGENSIQQAPETASWTSVNPSVKEWIDNGTGTADDGHTIRADGYSVEVGAFGKSSSALGGKSQALGKKSHAEGSKNIAFESNAHAEGNETFAAGKHSHSEGNTTAATGAASHAEGISTYASGDAAHVEGQGTVATWSYAHAEGLSSKAMGEAAHAEGVGNTASAQGAHAEGAGNTASGRASHAEGDTNKATGDVSHAGGALSEANHPGAFVHGAGVKSGAPYQTAIGEWNAISDDAMFVIGGGAAEADRKNIFEVKKNGEAFLGTQKIATLADINNAGGSGVVYVDYSSFKQDATDYTLIQGYINQGLAVIIVDTLGEEEHIYYTLSNQNGAESWIGHAIGDLGPEYMFTCIQTASAHGRAGKLDTYIKRIYVDMTSGANKLADVKLEKEVYIGTSTVGVYYALQDDKICFCYASGVKYPGTSVPAPGTLLPLKYSSGIETCSFGGVVHFEGTDETTGRTIDEVCYVERYYNNGSGPTKQKDTVIPLSGSADVSGKMDKFGEVTTEDGATVVALNEGTNIRNIADPVEDSDAVNKSYVDTKIGDIESVLDSIIAIQNSLLGGNA